MKIRTALIAASFILALGTGAQTPAQAQVYGAKGNDNGGIIPWSPAAEWSALDIAQANCGRFNEYAVITSIHRVYGDYIAYKCTWREPRRWARR